MPWPSSRRGCNGRESELLKQEELADRAGARRTYLSGVEQDHRNPTVVVLEWIPAA